MITILARLKIQPGKEAEGEKALSEMAAAVEANEPGALTYIFHRSQNDPTRIVLFEMYADGEAFDAHGQSPHMGQFRAAFASVFDPAAVTIERLERFAGFVRPPT